MLSVSAFSWPTGRTCEQLIPLECRKCAFTTFPPLKKGTSEHECYFETRWNEPVIILWSDGAAGGNTDRANSLACMPLKIRERKSLKRKTGFKTRTEAPDTDNKCVQRLKLNSTKVFFKSSVDLVLKVMPYQLELVAHCHCCSCVSITTDQLRHAGVDLVILVHIYLYRLLFGLDFRFNATKYWISQQKKSVSGLVR